MEEKKTASPENRSLGLNTIAAIIFAVMALLRLINMFSFKITLISVLYLISYAVPAFFLYKNDRSIFTVAGFGLFAVARLIPLFGGSLFPAAALLYAVSAICMLIFALAYFTEYIPKLRDTAKKLWFVPGVIYAIAALAEIIGLFVSIYSVSATGLFSSVLMAAGLTVAGLWMAYPDGLPKTERTPNAPGAGSTVAEGDGCCSLAKHILLMIFTFGVWYCIWIYRMTRFLNRVEGEEYRDPAKKLLLCMFVPFYIIFWTYKSAQRVDRLAKSVGVSSDISTLCLILAIFVGIVPPILIQDKVNAIVAVETGAAQPEAKPKGAVNTADELKKFKELLDVGAITEEEYELKKKELLGL